MTDESAPREPTFAEKWVFDFRLIAVIAAKTYGSLAIGALIALNALAWCVTREPQFVWGAALGAASAFAAYVNFTAVAEDRSDGVVSATMAASIVAGIAAGVIFLTAAF